MDTRTARRAAEKAARDLINGRAALVGELGVMHAERARLAEEVKAAAEQGRQLIADAGAEASSLVTSAQDLARAGAQLYADAYQVAAAGGWTAADLAALGFEPASTGTRRRRAPATEQQPDHGSSLVTLLEQPAVGDLQAASAPAS